MLLFSENGCQVAIKKRYMQKRCFETNCFKRLPQHSFKSKYYVFLVRKTKIAMIKLVRYLLFESFLSCFGSTYILQFKNRFFFIFVRSIFIQKLDQFFVQISEGKCFSFKFAATACCDWFQFNNSKAHKLICSVEARKLT